MDGPREGVREGGIAASAPHYGAAIADPPSARPTMEEEKRHRPLPLGRIFLSVVTELEDERDK